MPRGRRWVSVCGEWSVVGSTEKGVQVRRASDGATEWFPRSMVDMEALEKEGRLRVAEWFAERNRDKVARLMEACKQGAGKPAEPEKRAPAGGGETVAAAVSHYRVVYLAAEDGSWIRVRRWVDAEAGVAEGTVLTASELAAELRRLIESGAAYEIRVRRKR